MPDYTITANGVDYKISSPQELNDSQIMGLLGPIDTGQGYVASLANAAGRGFASVVPGVIGGIGAVTGSETLLDAADSVEGAINSALPINPVNEGWGTIIAGGVGQAANVAVTAGAGGFAAKALSFGRAAAEVAAAVNTGSTVASMGSGILAGSREGADMADRQELEGTAYAAAVLGKGALEFFTEKLPFGNLAETTAARKIFGGTISEKRPGFTLSTLSEGAEEVTTQVGSNALERSLAAPGAEVPTLLEGTAEAGVGGMAGGAFFGALNFATGAGGQPTAPEATATPNAALPDASAAFSAPVATEAPKPVTIAVAGVPFSKGDDGLWRKPVTDFEAERDIMDENGMVLLNPDDPVAGSLIPVLENEAGKLTATSAPAPAEQPPPATEAPAPTDLEQLPTLEEVITPPADEQPITIDEITDDIDGVPALAPAPAPVALRPTPPPAFDPLPPPNGGSDIIQVMRDIGAGLGGPQRGTAEWEWYTELEGQAAESPLKQASADAAARRGEVDDPKAMLAWLHQKGIVTPGAPAGNLDEVAEILSGNGQETAGSVFQVMNVSASELGPTIIAAISARRAALEMPDPTSDMERETQERERAQEAAFIAHDVTSTAPEMTAASLAQVVTEGSTITIAGKPFTVEYLDAERGAVGLSNPEIGSVLLRGPDTLRPELIDDQSQDVATADEDPFSLGTGTGQTVATVRQAITAAIGAIPARVQIIDDPAALNEQGQAWKAKVENGIITLNAAHIESPADAVWNVEHEAAHEVYRAAETDPAIKKAWAALEGALSRNPDIAAEVAALDYSTRARAEESAVRLAQKLDGTAKSAWEAFKEAVFNFLSGQWSKVTTPFADRAAAEAATLIMQAARAGVTGEAGPARFSNAAASRSKQPPSYSEVMARYEGQVNLKTTKRGRTYSTIVRDLLQRRRDGESISPEVLDRAIKQYFPSSKVTVPKSMADLPSQEKILSVITKDKVKLHKEAAENGFPASGSKVTVRQDVPSWYDHKVGVVTMVTKNGDFYLPSARLLNAKFKTNETQTLKIGTGEKDKGPHIAIIAEWTNNQSMPTDLENWTQVGFNPDRHSFYYERGTERQVVSADEIFQVGNTVFARGAVFEDVLTDIRYSLASTGNAQPLSENVQTPDGLTPIGSLFVGADIITNAGKSASVIGRYLKGKKPVFKITLEDGRTTRATADHLWMVETGATLTTADLLGRLVPALERPA